MDTGHEQVIARTGTGDVEQQIAFGVGNLFQIRVISQGFDARFQRNDFIVGGSGRSAKCMRD